MAERYNGNAPFSRRTHGSGRRGVFAVPSHNYLAQLRQSATDTEKRINKARLLSAIKEKHTDIPLEYLEPTLETFDDPVVERNLGNAALPIFGYKQELIDTIDAHKAVILMGATGSGKSSQLPQYLYEAGYDHTFVIQGRRIMADGLGERIQNELTAQMGEEADNLVGIIHGGRVQRHDDNKITILTANTFIRMGADIKKQFGGKRVALIPDEIHEDDPHTEIAVGLAGMMTRDEENFRLIGASATINPDAIKEPLGRITNPEKPAEVEVPVFTVEGRPFNVDIFQAADLDPADAYLAHGTGHSVAILSTKGKKQIDAIRTKVQLGLGAAGSNVEFRELSGGTSPFQRAAIEEYARTLPEGQRLVVIASPAGRSGITIPGATFAATDGMINREIRNSDGHWGLQTDYMTQAEIIQVLGRVGRDTPGAVGYVCQPMPAETRNPKRIEEYKTIYPFKSMSDRDEYPVPAIFNTNMSGMALEVAAIGQNYPELNKFTLNELDDASVNNVRTRLINTFGALDHDGKITAIGKLMDTFPVVAELSRGLAEGILNGRSRQHMARAALVAAAVDVGGIQQFKSTGGEGWKQDIRGGSDDDFIALLDIFIALREAEKDHTSIQDRYNYLYDKDLNYKRTDDAQKIAQKVLRRLGIDHRTFEIEPPSYAEIADLREDFTAGMFDSVYRDAGKQDKERLFTHIRDKEDARFRTISDRSVTEPAQGQIIAGIPQYYQEIKKGRIEIKDVLTMTLKVDPKVVGHFALLNNLVDYTPIKNSSRINGGMVLERENIMFGSLHVGSRDVAKSREMIPAESQKALVQHVLHNPGPMQQSLRSTADELSEYRRILPSEELAQYRRPQAPTDFTKADIERLLRNYAERTRNAQELDLLLGEHASQKNISINHYYDAQARAEILARSPASVMIGGTETTILYDNGDPYVTRVTKAQEKEITGPIYLDDGREVLRQVKKEGGRGTRRVSFGQLEA